MKDLIIWGLVLIGFVVFLMALALDLRIRLVFSEHM